MSSRHGRATPATGSEQHTPVHALSPNCQLHSPQHTGPPSWSLNALRSAHCGTALQCRLVVEGGLILVLVIFILLLILAFLEY